jgi:SsrA-binding protein
VVEKVQKNNKFAGFKFFTEEKFEAGIVLSGQDVKDIRKNAFNIRESFVILDKNEVFLMNLILDSAPHINKKRKLLLHRSEISKISQYLQNKKYHGYVLAIRYNEKNLIKVDIGIGTIKKQHEKKSSEKRMSEKRDVERQIEKGLI